MWRLRWSVMNDGVTDEQNTWGAAGVRQREKSIDGLLDSVISHRTMTSQHYFNTLDHKQPNTNHTTINQVESAETLGLESNHHV